MDDSKNSKKMEDWLMDLNSTYFYYLFRIERRTFHNFINVIRKTVNTEYYVEVIRMEKTLLTITRLIVLEQIFRQ